MPFVFSNHNKLRYCILEKLGRCGINGYLQTDLINELKTNSKNLFTSIKHLQHSQLIIIENDIKYSNCNRIWLTKYKFRSNIKILSLQHNNVSTNLNQYGI